MAQHDEARLSELLDGCIVVQHEHEISQFETNLTAEADSACRHCRRGRPAAIRWMRNGKAGSETDGADAASLDGYEDCKTLHKESVFLAFSMR
jgi:hypothetical protein